MMTKEHAKAKLAAADAKIDFFEGLTARIERMIDEIEMARHDNLLFDFGEDWTLADNVADGWDASETACEGLGYLREVCEQQLNREVNKSETLFDYLTRLEGQAKPVTVTANSVDIDTEDERDFDETQIDFVDAEDRLNYLSALEPFKAEFKAALRGIYLDTDGYWDEEIVPAVDWAQLMAPMYVTDHSTTAYRKNADGTFTEDAAAYKRLREVELKMFRFGNPELDDAQADSDKVTATNSADIDDAEPATEKSPDQIADELTAILQTKTIGATWHVHTRLQGDCGYRSLILNKLKVKADWYTGKGYDFYHHEVLAHYDTAEQVAKVIGRIGAVATFKENEFNFPHVAELTATNYREKQWAVDFDIYHEDSDLTEEELRDYTDALSDAMTANGNCAHVELETCLITVWGDSGGDNTTVNKIVDEMLKRGCWNECPDVDDEDTAE